MLSWGPESVFNDHLTLAGVGSLNRGGLGERARASERLTRQLERDAESVDESSEGCAGLFVHSPNVVVFFSRRVFCGCVFFSVLLVCACSFRSQNSAWFLFYLCSSSVTHLLIKMVREIRVQYRRRHCYRTKSNKVKVTKTPGALFLLLF